MSLSEHHLLSNAANGDEEAISLLFTKHRSRLKRMINARLDPRLTARIDASDVVQEVHVEVTRRLPEYMARPEVPFFNWMRSLAKQKLIEIVRRHVHAQARDVRREQPLTPNFTADSSVALAGVLLEQVPSPSSAIGREEIKTIVEQAISSLDEIDREILILRHVEQLKTIEAATELGITQSTCRQRHVRALKRLRDALAHLDLSWGLI